MAAHRRNMFDLARRQHGLLTLDDLRDLGVPRGVRRGMVADGSLRRLSQRVYLAGGVQMEAPARLRAATLDTAAPASHAASAWLHGIPGFVLPPRPDVLRLGRERAHQSDLARVHTTTSLPRHDVTEVDGIPTISVARTLMTLAASGSQLSAERMRQAVDDAVRLRLATDPWLWWRLEQLRCRGRDGVAVLEAILSARAESATESWLERELLRVVDEAGLPLPICQERVAARGAFVARVDFLYPEVRIVIEVSGAIAHASAEQRASDASRRNRLLLQGYLVLEFTYEQVVRSPEMVVAAIRDALACRRVA
jgi:hypothetical protein